MSSPHRGDIYWISLDPTIGAEIKKTRPCVIISPDAANRSGPLVIVAPITKAGRKNTHSNGALLVPFSIISSPYQLSAITYEPTSISYPL